MTRRCRWGGPGSHNRWDPVRHYRSSGSFRALGAVVGPADVLIDNAALTVETPFADDSDKTAHLFQRTLDVNVAGLTRCAQVFAKTMNEGGRIIFTASFWAKTAGPRYSAYVASKHAIIGLVRTLAVELGPRGISVNAVCPHSMATERAFARHRMLSQGQRHRCACDAVDPRGYRWHIPL